MIKLFPHYAINVKDNSLELLKEIETLPLFRPLYTMKTESGPVGIPVWCDDLPTAKKIFGKSTFDKHNPTYYSRASAFLATSLPYSGAFIVRLDSPPMVDEVTDGVPMKTATQVLYANYATDQSSNKTLWYSLEPLAEGETLESLNMGAASLGNVEVDTYKIAIMLLSAKDAGAYGNELGFALSHSVSTGTLSNFVNTGVMDLDEMLRLKTYKYTIGFYELDSITATANHRRTKYSEATFDFAVESDVIDPALNAPIGYQVQEDRNYGVEYPAPMSVHVYEDNIKYLVGVMAGVATAMNDATLATFIDDNKSTINIFTMTTQIFTTAEETYDIGGQLGIDLVAPAGETAITIAANTIHYLEGGDNGDLDVDDINTSEILDKAMIDVLSLNTNPEMEDNARYPFNMLVDTGYVLDVKNAMISMNSVRGDVKSILSTWSHNADQVMSSAVVAGQGLDTTVRTYKESAIYGTNAFRGVIFGQVGELYSDAFVGQLPMTLWYVHKLAQMHNLTYIAENPEGETAMVEIFRPESINWVPFNDASKQALWAASVNYCQYYNQKGLHFPAIKSVYEYESSLFTNDAYVNMCIYVKQVFPHIWAKYANSSDPNAVVYNRVLQDLDAELLHLLHGTAEFRTQMYQTASEKLKGFEHHIAVTLLDDLGQRIWNIDLIGERLSS